jgi:hypothetical protein
VITWLITKSPIIFILTLILQDWLIWLRHSLHLRKAWEKVWKFLTFLLPRPFARTFMFMKYALDILPFLELQRFLPLHSIGITHCHGWKRDVWYRKVGSLDDGNGRAVGESLPANGRKVHSTRCRYSTQQAPEDSAGNKKTMYIKITSS